MRQRITIEQLKELNEESKEKLRDWWLPTEGDVYISDNTSNRYVVGTWTQGDEQPSLNQLKRSHKYSPLFSVGQMIEFIEESDSEIWISVSRGLDESYADNCSPDRTYDVDLGSKSFSSYSMCDALWEAVKYILEEKK